MLRLSLIVSAAMGILASAEVRSDAAPAQTSVCELAKAAKAMNGRSVRLTAVFVSDLMHVSVLKDRGCPSEGVSPLQAEDATQDPSVEGFDNAMRGNPEDHELRVFLVDVSGVYRWRESETPHGGVTFEKVWNFKRRHGDWRKAQRSAAVHPAPADCSFRHQYACTPQSGQ